MNAGSLDNAPINQDLKIIRVLASLFFIAIMAVLPVYVTSSGYTNIIQYKTHFFYAVTAVFSALAVPFMIYCKFSAQGRLALGETKRPVSLPEWALFAFIWLTLLSAVLSRYGDVVWTGYGGRYEGFWAFLCYGAVFFFISRLYVPKRIHMVIAAAAAILVAAYAVCQFLGYDFLKLFPYTDARFTTGAGVPMFVDQAGNSLYGPLSMSFRTTLGNPNVVAAYGSFAAVLFALLFAGEKRESRWVYLAASALSFFLLLISNGDGGKVGVLGAMALFIPYWVAERERLGKILIALSGWSAAAAVYHGYLSAVKAGADLSALPINEQTFIEGYAPPAVAPFIILAAVLLCAGLLLTLLLKKWPGKAMKRAGVIFLLASVLGGLLFVEFAGKSLSDDPGNIIFQAREMLHGNLDDSFGTHRGWVWKRGLSVIPDNPVLGTGPDTFYYALGDALQREAHERYNEVFDKAHNMFIQIAVCQGVPALLAFLTLLGGLFAPAVKAAFKRPLLLAFTAAAFAYLLQSFFEVDMPVDKPLLWASLGIMAGELWRWKAGGRSDELF